MTINEGNKVLMKEAEREKKALINNVKGKKDHYKNDMKNIVRQITN